MRLFILSVFFLGGCAATLNENASSVAVVTAEQKSNCQSLGLINTQHKLGSNKPKSAMNKALNEVVRLGGDSIYIISTNLDWAEGATVSAEALKCK